MTRRDLQNGMAAEKKPWEIGKSFDHARCSVNSSGQQDRSLHQGPISRR